MAFVGKMKFRLAVTLFGGMLTAFTFGIPSLAYAGQPTDACSLLSATEVSSVLGLSVGAGQRVVASSPLLCGWEPGGSSVNSKRVVAAIIKVDQFTHEKTPLQGITETQASGIGDEAHYMTTPGFGTGLSVKKGSFAFKIRVYGFPLDQVEAKEKALALDTLKKL